MTTRSWVHIGMLNVDACVTWYDIRYLAGYRLLRRGRRSFPDGGIRQDSLQFIPGLAVPASACHLSKNLFDCLISRYLQRQTSSLCSHAVTLSGMLYDRSYQRLHSEGMASLHQIKFTQLVCPLPDITWPRQQYESQNMHFYRSA